MITFFRYSIVCLSLGFAVLSQAQTLHFSAIEYLAEQEVGRRVLPQIYQRIGREITISSVPANRAQLLATSGELDGEIMRIYSYGSENPSTLRVPTAYYQFATMAFVRKDSGIVSLTPEQLKNYRIVKVRGVKHTDNITRGLSNAVDFSSTQEIMNMVSLGRADIALTSVIDGSVILEKMAMHELRMLDKPLAVLDLYHYLHQSHVDLIPPLDAAIKKLKASGELDRWIKLAERQVRAELTATQADVQIETSSH